MNYFLLMTSAMLPGNIPSAAASTLSASRSRTDLAVGRSTVVTKEALMDPLSGNSGLLAIGVFPKGLVRRVDVDLNVDELEARIQSYRAER